MSETNSTSKQNIDEKAHEVKNKEKSDINLEILQVDNDDDIPSSLEIPSDSESKQPRIRSALTVENVKKLEKETKSVALEEFIIKNREQELKKSNHDIILNQDRINVIYIADDEYHEEIVGLPLNEEEPLIYPTPDQPLSPIESKKSLVFPASRKITKGFKLTGEEYVAISVDVQTDESWINDYKKKYLPGLNTTTTVAPTFYNDRKFEKRKKKYLSDISLEERDDKEKNVDSVFEKSDMEAEFNDDEPHSPMINVSESKNLDFKESDLLHENNDMPLLMNNVGPPFILQYKAESNMQKINYATVEKNVPDDLDFDNLNEKQKSYYAEMLDEMKNLKSQRNCKDIGMLINIHPHSAYGSHHDQKIAKEHAAERNRLREIEKQKHSGPATSNQTNFYAFARQLKTVNYALSSEKCMEEGWTVRPVTPTSPSEVKERNLLADLTADIITGKQYNRKFVFKEYSNGNPFVAIFPDGTGTVWYMSGNPAISIISSEKNGKLSFLIHSDVNEDHNKSNIIATFSASGNCVCYYPSGSLQMLLSPIGGEYFNENGWKIKQWTWKGPHYDHVHAPPFQPITFILSKHVSLRVISQENIFLTFMEGIHTVRFNVGTKIYVRNKTKMLRMNENDNDKAYLEDKILYVRMIIDRFNNCMKFPNSPRLKKIKLPNYLLSKDERNVRKKIDKIGNKFPEISQIKMPKKLSLSTKSTKMPKISKRGMVATQDTVEVQPLVTVN